jgi:hypothetical protein
MAAARRPGGHRTNCFGNEHRVGNYHTFYLGSIVQFDHIEAAKASRPDRGLALRLVGLTNPPGREMPGGQHALQQVVLQEPAMIDDAGEMCGNRQHEHACACGVQSTEAAMEQVSKPSDYRKGQQQHIICA